LAEIYGFMTYWIGDWGVWLLAGMLAETARVLLRSDGR
jgi:hypothetical protein